MVFHVEHMDRLIFVFHVKQFLLTVIVRAYYIGPVGHNQQDLVHMTETTATDPVQGRIVAVANQKGGVGKTTTAINLATSIALPAGASCSSTSIRRAISPAASGSKGERADAGTVYEALLTDGAPDRFVLPTQIDNLCADAGRSQPHGRRNRAGPAARARAPAQARARPAARAASTTSSSTAHRRSACSRSMRSSPPTRS